MYVSRTGDSVGSYNDDEEGGDPDDLDAVKPGKQLVEIDIPTIPVDDATSKYVRVNIRCHVRCHHCLRSLSV